MCDDDAGSIQEQDIDKARRYNRWSNQWLFRSGIFSVVTFVLGLIVLGITASVKNLDSRWFGCLIIFVGVYFFVTLAMCSKNNVDSFEWVEKLYVHHGFTERLNNKHFKELIEANEFIDKFRPSQEKVDLVLKEAALHLSEAFKKEDNLYRTGLGYRAAQDDLDYETESGEVEKVFNTSLAEIKAKVKEAKDEFWRLHKLAKDHGYKVLDSWKPYVGILVSPKARIGWPVGQEPKEIHNEM